MKRAYNLIREQPLYRREAMSSGLRAAGYVVDEGLDYHSAKGPQGRPGDVLLIWSRYGKHHEMATVFEAGGGVVLVAENGFVGPGGISPHSTNDRRTYAMARSRHNGAGEWESGGPERWDALGIELKPWRESGGHILLAPNRAFGTPKWSMPGDWPLTVRARLRQLTGREIRLRPHPGNQPPAKPLADDLAGAHCMVIWGSSAGVHSLIAGVPVICDAPAWICKSAAGTLEQIENPPMPDRLPALRRLAWAQWHLPEIEDGTAFRHLLT